MFIFDVRRGQHAIYMAQRFIFRQVDLWKNVEEGAISSCIKFANILEYIVLQPINT